MRMNGAEILRRSLLSEGVEVLFGYPGGAILPFYDVLHGNKGPRHVLMRHEQSVAHAADGYARATGKTGVCVATSGPGASNLVTGLGTALMDSVPMVAVTGQVPSTVLGTDAFQEIDIVGITMPVTKHGYLVQRVEDIPVVVEEAFRIARSGRPGPTIIDVPKDVQLAEVDARPGRWSVGLAHGGKVHANEDGSDAAPAEDGLAPATGKGGSGTAPAPDGFGTAPASDGWDATLAAVRSALAEARRPVLMVGRGVVLAEVSSALRLFAERHQLPVITTLLGLDAFPSGHPLSLGMPGMHGTERANLAIQHADLVIGLGLRFDDRVTGHVPGFAPEATIVHFDISRASIGRTIRPDMSVVGDLRETLPALARRARCRDLGEWWFELSAWAREAEPLHSEPAPSGELSGRSAARALGRWLGDRGAVVTTDVGQHQMWLAQELRDAMPASHLTSGGLGTMGFALPAAIGALVGRPDREVWVVAGDGGFQMSVQELATVVQEGLPLRIAVINNASLGLVRQWQDLTYGQRYVASALSGPDLGLLAHSYGLRSQTVATEAELGRALECAGQTPGPVLFDIRVPAEENVYPMVAAGSTLSEMVRGPQRAAL